MPRLGAIYIIQYRWFFPPLAVNIRVYPRDPTANKHRKHIILLPICYISSAAERI